MRSGTENIHLDTGPLNSRRRSKRFSWRIRRGSPPSPRQDSYPDAGEARNDFWSMSENFIYRHHVEPRVKLYSPREESFPIPLKYIDVSRTTHTDLDVMQESRIDYYWNIDGSRDLSDSWTGFAQFTLLSEKPPEGYMWSEERLTKRQATSRPDHLWPELWIKLGGNAELKEKHKWSNEKPKLDNVRKLRGIYFIDPEDKEFKETVNNARKKLETPMAPAMLCKTSKKNKHGKTRGKTNDISNQKLRVSWKPVNPQECVWKNLYQNIMRTILQEKGTIHYNMNNLVHKFISMHQAMKIPAAKAAVVKAWEKLQKIPAWDITKVRNKSEVIDEARTKGIKVHFASLKDMSSEECRIGDKPQMPVIMTGMDHRTVEVHRCSSWTRFSACPLLCCEWCLGPDSAVHCLAFPQLQLVHHGRRHSLSIRSVSSPWS